MLLLSKPTIQPHVFDNTIPIDVLRLDKIHPVVSGNKYFKLYFFVQDAIAQQSTGVLTFGGGYSNHLAATAFYAHHYHLKSIGVVRGDYSQHLAPTLRQCMAWGMQIQFVDKHTYTQNKRLLQGLNNPHHQGFYQIPEGGFGHLGTKGITQWFQHFNFQIYDVIVLSVGTGTTLAGIANALAPYPHIRLLGMAPFKNYTTILQDIKPLLHSLQSLQQITINTNYHFGGFGKTPPQIVDFMHLVQQQHGLPLDKIYTAKALKGTLDLIQQSVILPTQKVLFIHTGGLQGNQH